MIQLKTSTAVFPRHFKNVFVAYVPRTHSLEVQSNLNEQECK